MAQRIEAKEPEKAAAFMLLAAHPDISVNGAAKFLGIAHQTAHDLYERLRTEYLPELETLRKYTTDEFLALIDNRIGRALEHLTDEKLEKAEVRDLAVAIGILVEKRQLLRGEPTSIISVEDRRRLTDLIPLLVAEAARRGEIIDLNPGDFSRTNGQPLPDAHLRPDKPDIGEPIQEVRQRGGKMARRRMPR